MSAVSHPNPGAPANLPGEPEYVELFGGALRAWQPRRGFRFSVDAMLLAMTALEAHGGDVLELGTGVGVVLLLLARDARFRRLVGVEIQPSLAAYARANVVLGHLEDRVDIVQGDLRDADLAVPHEAFDVVVSNPPYYPVGEGHLNPDEERAIARHEVACRLPDVLQRMHTCLRPGGRGIVVYPAPRTRTLLEAAPQAGLLALSVQAYRSRAGYPARQVVVTFARAPEAATHTPPDWLPVIDLHDEAGRHTGPLAAFFARLESSAVPD